MRSYIDLIRTHPRLLTFGVLQSFFSNLGKSFVISLFVPHIREVFQLQRTEFGTLYSIATLATAALLPVAGRLIDRFNLRLYSLAVGLLMLAAYWLTAWAATVPLLFLGMFGLRFSGHGMMTHIESISISRYFGPLRGKALGITSLGYSLGAAILPVVSVWLIGWVGWRLSFFLLGLSCALVLLPFGDLLIRPKADFQLPPAEAPGSQAGGPAFHMSRREVLRSPYFYSVVPLMVCASFFFGGLLFHQGSLSAHKGWSPGWIACCFVVFAIVQSLSGFLVGPVVDRFTARAIFPLHVIPMALAAALLAGSRSPWAGAVSFGLIGITMGVGRSVRSAVWAEVYGTAHLGAIRSLAFTIMILAAALSPGLVGWFLDLGADIDTLLLIASTLIVAGSLLGLFAPLPQKEPPKS